MSLPDPRPNLNAKLQAAYIRSVLRRRRAAFKRSYLYDDSVPVDFLFHGVVRCPRAAAPVAVRATSSHWLSPYVIHLADLPTPGQVLEAVPGANLSVNLLYGDGAPSGAFVSAPSADDLLLRAADVAGQLGEDPLLELPARPAWPQFFPRAFGSGRAAAVPPLATSAPTTRLAIDELAPPALPEDIFAYFDLPEADHEEAAARPLADDEIEVDNLVLPNVSDPRPAPLWRLPAGWPRALLVFVSLSFLVVLPLHAMNLVANLSAAKDQTLSAGQNALAEFTAGASAVIGQDPGAAAVSFGAASQNFNAARQNIDDLGVVIGLLTNLPTLADGKKLIAAGEELSIAGARLSDGWVALNDGSGSTLTFRLSLLKTYAQAALPHLQEAAALVAAVEPKDLPAVSADQVALLRSSLPPLVASLEEFVRVSDLLNTVLGGNGTKRYLLIFQNNTELRPTGGFMGSFAEVDLRDGAIVRLHIPGGGTYDLQGSLRENIAAPPPLQLLKARWEFQDTNWFPDFPTSARKIIEFYDGSGGATVDGVIAVNATYVARLIGLLGPVELASYGRTITEENFIFEAQKIAELEYDKAANRPKAFLGELAPLLLERAFAQDGDRFLSLLDFVGRGLGEREVQMYFTDDALQAQVKNLGWGGEVKWTDGDYLMVVDTNLGGGKTDGVIDQKVDLTVTIDDDGVIVNTVRIERTHRGLKQALFSGVNNVDYLRLYVPKGSTLLASDGFSVPDASLFELPDSNWRLDNDVYYSESTKYLDPRSGTEVFEESGKTVFGNWVQTKPGSTSVVTFTYRLPFTLDTAASGPDLFGRLKRFLGFPATQTYSLTVQKQSGVQNRATAVTINPPDNLDVLWSSQALNQVQFNNLTDNFFALIFEPSPTE